MAKKISRPPRIRKTKSGRKYVIIEGKKFYLKSKTGKKIRKTDAINTLVNNINLLTSARPRRVVQSRRYPVLKKPFRNELSSEIGSYTLGTAPLTVLAGVIRDNYNRINDVNRLELGLGGI